ncbi:hypothetical protein [Xenorhabdus bovienii]|uniref:Uncharacterized protein n=1 Tax=Xenorhabdus bovienii str. feltiae Moldova TaxID=1398200 RepID=A0A077NMQ0_XENBV|nr:hypothetical protein [Xenorhabdus bovienii]CDH03437.1 hypothetical protein XBFM1_760003 [Xenorhabdus bovienii str. feltiae Moldova]
MSDYGFGVWDEQGRQRNTGIRPFLYAGFMKVEREQTTGALTAPREPMNERLRLSYVFLCTDRGYQVDKKRQFLVKDNQIIISDGNDGAVEGWLIAYYTA